MTAGRTDGKGSGQGIFHSYDVAIRLRLVRRQMLPACNRPPLLSTAGITHNGKQTVSNWHNQDIAL
jgi:hypothetical protein